MKTKRTSKNRANRIRKINYSPHCKGKIERIFADLDAVFDCFLINKNSEISPARISILIDDHTRKIVKFRLKP